MLHGIIRIRASATKTCRMRCSEKGNIMKYAIIAIVVFFIVIFVAIKSASASLVAKNIVCIYQAIGTYPGAKKLSRVKKYYITILLDLLMYIQNGTISNEQLLETAVKVGKNTQMEEEDALVMLTKEILLRIMAVDTKKDETAIAASVEKQARKVRRIIRRELRKPACRKSCKRWLPAIKSYLKDEHVIESMKNLW